MTYVPDTFAGTLKALMTEQRVSSAELSKRTGIDERLIRKYRAGHSVPRDAWGDPSENARQIARALTGGELLLAALAPKATA